MKKNANKKIFTLLTLLISSILSVFFIFHLYNDQAKSSLANNQRMVFNPAREIKSFTINISQENKFSNLNFLNHYTLAFFGFTHCPTICPNTLKMLSEAYPILKKEFPNLQILMISLDPERDSLETLNQYVKQFNSDFIGATGSLSSIRFLQSQFNVASLREEGPNDYQIQHTTTIFLINPAGKWAGIFHYGLETNAFIHEFKETLKLVSSSYA